MRQCGSLEEAAGRGAASWCWADLREMPDPDALVEEGGALPALDALLP